MMKIKRGCSSVERGLCHQGKWMEFLIKNYINKASEGVQKNLYMVRGDAQFLEIGHNGTIETPFGLQRAPHKRINTDEGVEFWLLAAGRTGEATGFMRNLRNL